MGAESYRPEKTQGGKPLRFPYFSHLGKEVAIPENPGGAERNVRRLPPLEGHALWAATYDSDPNPLLALEERTLDPLLPMLQRSFVLDVACGTGRWLTRLLQRGACGGAGVDLCHEMLQRAGKKPPLHGRILRADCLAMPVREGVAGVIVCSFAAGYISDLCGLASEMARVSRPGADLFLTDVHPAGRLRGWKRAFRRGTETIEILSLSHSIQQVTDAFETEGFTLLRSVSPSLDEPEKGIFERERKVDLYEAARDLPAIFVCHFRGHSPAPKGGGTR